MEEEGLEGRVRHQLSPPKPAMASMQAWKRGLEDGLLAKWTAGRLGAREPLVKEQVLSAMVYELPVQGKLLEWQVGKQPAGGDGWLAEPTWFCCIKQSIRLGKCVCVCFVGVDCRQSVTDPGAAGIVGGLEAWRSST